MLLQYCWQHLSVQVSSSRRKLGGETGTSLYIQNSKSGSLIPIKGEENLYILTLNDVSVWTIQITDAPEYATVKVHTRAFLDTVDFSHEPLSAVIELLEGDEEADLVAVQLTEPVYDFEEETLKYKAEIISHDYAPDYLKRHAGEDLAARVDERIPETFDDAFVYIHSKEPVKKAVPMSASTQRLSTSTAVIALSVPKTSTHAVAYQAAASTPCKMAQQRSFHGSIEHVAGIEGTLVLCYSDAYLHAEIELVGFPVSSCRLDVANPSYCVRLLTLKACATAHFTSSDPARGSLSFQGCYLLFGK